MREMPDNAFDLAVVDPVYGGVTQGGYMKQSGETRKGGFKTTYHKAIWEQEKTGKEYFDELFRVSANQVIWGGNYFQKVINRDSQCWLVWDKQNDNSTYADCELAWTSYNSATRIFRFTWDGFRQQDMKHKEKRIHPTQKQVALYAWIFRMFAKPGMKILDTHLGSGSSRLAAWDAGLDFTGYEIDKVYFDLQEKRFQDFIAQGNLFWNTTEG
jgi:site-specific DNA-methyltransferase (adenine-specific)